jgi:hypothetical protein
MIVNKDLNSSDPTLKKWMTAIRYLHMAKRSAPSSEKNLLPPLPIDFNGRSLPPLSIPGLSAISIGSWTISTSRYYANKSTLFPGTQSFDH